MTSTNQAPESSEKDKRKKDLALQAKFSQRITIARHGREAFLKKEYPEAAKKYNEYLGILAQTHEVTDIFSLTPKHFNGQKDITELLLISHIYWELARIYEMTPKLQPTFQKALDQFVLFTINQPFQVLNSEMLRKYLKANKRKSRQPQALEQAFRRIHVESAKCFIASEVAGQNHWLTQDLRLFKSFLTDSKLGAYLVSAYYRFSISLLRNVFHNKKIHPNLRLILKKIIYTGLVIINVILPKKRHKQ